MKTYYYVETGEIVSTRIYFRYKENALRFQKEYDGDVVSFKADEQDLKAKGILFTDDYRIDD